MTRSTLKEAKKYWEMILASSSQKMDDCSLSLDALNRLKLRRDDIDIGKLTDIEFKESCGISMSSFRFKYYDSIGNLNDAEVHDSLECVKHQWGSYLISLIQV